MMRKLFRTATISAFAAAAMSASLLSQAQDKQFIAIGTGGPTGVYFQVGQAVCQMVHAEAAEGRKEGMKHGIRCSAPSTGGSTYNIGQIAQGELDFGVAQADWQFHAVNCSKEDKVTCFKDLRAVFSVHPEPYHVIAAEGSGIQSWNDLEGKRFNIGNPGSGQRGTTEELISGHGWSMDKFGQTTELTSTEQSSALCDGKIDAYGYTVGVPNAGVSVATDGCDAYIVDLGDDSAAQALVDEHAYYSWATIPAGTYKTTDKDTTTFGVRATFVTSADVPDDVVYAVTKAVFENIDTFRRLHPAFANLKPETMISAALSAPLHAGAKKYYKEKGWL
ncbi:MAG: hypothetical protein MAG794_01180 [Gammaproteobacteria bacterium]|nr:hypothetical protein [Gammaproteobacteria bacterium]